MRGIIKSVKDDTLKRVERFGNKGQKAVVNQLSFVYAMIKSICSSGKISSKTFPEVIFLVQFTVDFHFSLCYNLSRNTNICFVLPKKEDC